MLEREECAVGGASLEQHWKRAEACARDPADPAGRYPTGKSPVDALASRPWDVVTIQQVSTLSHDRFRHRIDPAFDPARAVHPALPEQSGSLHVGWTWKRGEDGGWKLVLDDRHASVAGSYLAGCVWLETLFDASSVGNPFVPPGLAPADASALQEIAHRAAVARRGQPALVP